MSIVLILILIILLIIVGIYLELKKKTREFSKNLFGTSNIFEGIRRQKIELSNEPKSVAGMESLLLPNLIKDFPNLNISEFKKTAEKQIILCLEAVENKDLSKLNFVSEKIINWINSKISDLGSNDTVNYDSIRFHRTVLNKYIKVNGMCSIIFQTSVEYLYRKNDSDYTKIQGRFNTEFIYIYDDSKIGKDQGGIALNCPNCGAPIKDLGVKVCSYCGTGVIDLVNKTWILNDISQV